MKIIKKANKEISSDKLSSYVESLIAFSNGSDLDPEINKIIKNFPTPRYIQREMLKSECAVLSEMVRYVWKQITGKDLLDESKIIENPDFLLGNYWMFQSGMLLHGINHFTIIKQYQNILPSLININAFTLQEYLSSEPEKLIFYIIKNGGVRMFINKNRRAIFQMSPESYGTWAKERIKKYDFHEKNLKIIDLNKEYDGWNSGITIKI